MHKILLSILLLVFSCEELLDNLEPDITAPIVVITYPANNSTLDTTTTISADVTDDGDIKMVDFLIDALLAHTDTLSPYEYEWDVCAQMGGSPLFNPDIPHTMLVQATDSTGNLGKSDLFSYTLSATYDCADVCGGESIIDDCGVCDGNNSPNTGTCDCMGIVNGTAYIDGCGVCVGSNTGLDPCPNDCLGVPGGTAYLDNCGTCDIDTTNDCIQDCAGEWGGTSWVSDCGCVLDTNTGDDCDDCAGTPNGDKVADNCGTCDIDTTNDCIQDCAGEWGGSSWISDCGCVLDTNTGDDCDDCAGTPNGIASVNSCSICTGGNTSYHVNYCGTITDIDDNVYKTVIIGNQIWMAENLKVTKYNDVTEIPNQTDDFTWFNLTTGAYCDLNNDPLISVTHGKLYNAYSVYDIRGVCMEEWHVPSEDDVYELITYLGQTSGLKMKEEGTTHWRNPNTGATNESGFTAFAMGFRYGSDGKFSINYGISGDNAVYAWFWTSSGNVSETQTQRYQLGESEEALLFQGYENNKTGFSIRCVKD